MAKKLTQEEFIQKAKDVHGDSFDYTDTIYLGRRNNITIKCNSCHSTYETNCHRHLCGFGCRSNECRYAGRTLEQFVEEATKLHNGKYSYNNNNSYQRLEHICITCPIHGNFHQLPGNHLSGQGCRKCVDTAKLGNTEEFIKEAKIIHGDKYDYSKSEYISSRSKITIICPKHGEFYPAPVDHILGKSVCRTCALEKRFGHIFEIGEIYREYRKYYKRVRYLTSLEYKNHKDKINPENKLRGVLQYHIDHMYSVKNGFLNNMPPEIISSYVNLTMLEYFENSRKSMNNSQTIEELQEKYNERIVDNEK